MKKQVLIKIILFAVSIFLICLTIVLLVIFKGGRGAFRKKISVCYYRSWAQNYEGKAKFLPQDIDPDLCSVINYSSNQINLQTYKIEGRQKNDEQLLHELVALKKKTPSLKISVNVGGWGHEKFPRFVNMVKYQHRRKIFIDSVVKYLTKHKLDGINLDWEYPGVYTRDELNKYPMERIKDKRRFIYLLHEMKIAFEIDAANRTGKRFILTLAVGNSRTKIAKGYDIPKISKLVDWIDIMAYNLRGHWVNNTGCPTHMRGNLPHIPDTVDAWIEGGMDRNKINLGLASYGKSFTLKDRSVYNVGAPTVGKGTKGNSTQIDGILAYYEICTVPWKHKISWRDSACGAPYASDDDNDMWVSYDNPSSIRNKVATLVNRRKLNGISFWALDFDDFSGENCNEGKYPLLRAAVDTMNEGEGFG